jgi:hypothetical protein
MTLIYAVLLSLLLNRAVTAALNLLPAHPRRCFTTTRFRFRQCRPQRGGRSPAGLR